jgi:hypothetical protein
MNPEPPITPAPTRVALINALALHTTTLAEIWDYQDLRATLAARLGPTAHHG